jgi:hypothetical protein
VPTQPTAAPSSTAADEGETLAENKIVVVATPRAPPPRPPGRYLQPTPLGLALIAGLKGVEPLLVDPTLAQRMEQAVSTIANARPPEADYNIVARQVVAEQLGLFAPLFRSLQEGLHESFTAHFGGQTRAADGEGERGENALIERETVAMCTWSDSTLLASAAKPLVTPVEPTMIAESLSTTHVSAAPLNSPQRGLVASLVAVKDAEGEGAAATLVDVADIQPRVSQSVFERIEAAASGGARARSPSHRNRATTAAPPPAAASGPARVPPPPRLGFEHHPAAAAAATPRHDDNDGGPIGLDEFLRDLEAAKGSQPPLMSSLGGGALSGIPPTGGSSCGSADAHGPAGWSARAASPLHARSGSPQRRAGRSVGALSGASQSEIMAEGIVPLKRSLAEETEALIASFRDEFLQAKSQAVADEALRHETDAMEASERPYPLDEELERALTPCEANQRLDAEPSLGSARGNSSPRSSKQGGHRGAAVARERAPLRGRGGL